MSTVEFFPSPEDLCEMEIDIVEISMAAQTAAANGNLFRLNVQEQGGEIISWDTYEMSSEEYIEYLRNGGSWGYVNPKEFII